MNTNTLTDDQLLVYDTVFMNSRRWQVIQNCIDEDFPSGEFTFLDVGGGNGIFADRILETYPKSQCTVVDNSELLINKNIQNNRKILLLADITEATTKYSVKYDIIFCNWILHHLIHNKSYIKSKRNINASILRLKKLLAPGGKISIYENMYNGLLIDSLPGIIIFHLTSIKFASKIIKRLGANTAGVGVCFLSYNQWCSLFKDCKLRVNKISKDSKWIFGLNWKIFLHMGKTYCAHFWLDK